MARPAPPTAREPPPGPTARLVLRELRDGDAPFILELLTSASFRRWIGERGVHDLATARAYVAQGPGASYARHGFGLWLIERRVDAAAIGLCGLLQRDDLDDVDIGYALLDRYAGQGYAFEAARACLAWAQRRGFTRVVAIVRPDNERSIDLLERLGLRFERRLPDDAAGQALALYGRSAAPFDELG
jgi:RimJ/RimL family protein N-acetyltransferase